jgi:cysteine desulfurase/selenocysteine lyase
MADIADLIGNADAFPALRRWTFLNHAGVSPLPRAVADAMRRFIDGAEASAYLDNDWFPQMERVRQSAATFIGAAKGEVALVKNTSEGISTVALGLDLKPGDRIVTADVEYPANVYPWMEACRRTGAELVMVAEEADHDGRRAVPLDKLLAAVDDPNTKVLTVSHVEFASGQRHDLAKLGAACRARDVFFNVDGIQSLGAVPLDVAAMNVDGLSACGHKWMMGPPGAGLFYIRQAWLDRVRPLLVGATTVTNWESFAIQPDYALRPDAGRYESGTPNLAGIFGWGAALDTFNAIGIDAVADRIKRLTDRLADGLELKGYAVVSPRTADAWSGIVAFTSPQHDHADLAKGLLKDHKVEIAVRAGRLRASPHFYNTEEQVERLIAAVPGH